MDPAVKRIKYISSLRNLPNDIKKTIEISENNLDLINIINKNNLFILGKEKSEAISKECALKIKQK